MSSILELDTSKSRYVNYLNELKTSRMMNSSSMRRSRFSSLDASKLNRNSLGLIENQARNLGMQDYLERKF